MSRGTDEYEELLRKIRNETNDYQNRYGSNIDDNDNKNKAYFDQYKDRFGDIQWEDVIADHIAKAAAFIGATFNNLFSKKENINAGGGGAGDNDSTQPPSQPRGYNMNLNWKSVTAIAVLVLTLLVSPLLIGINDAGHRTVIQFPNGTLSYKFDPGLYMQWFGNVEVYNDIITFDFDKSQNAEGATLDQNGIAVRYQDGGTGTVFGIARFRLPSTEVDMAKIHKEFRSNAGVAHKIVKNTTEEIMNHTAGLVSSEESYTDRGTYTQRAKTQLNNGKFSTVQSEITTVEAGMEFCLGENLTKELKKECHNVKKTKKIIPIIATKDGVPVHVANDLKQYGITLSGFNMVDWGYEDKTLKQISDKREATMAIITSKANAERAKQDAITAEQQGLANVKKAQYEEEVIKQKAVVVAQRVAEVAVIKAEQLVDVAAQGKLEALEKQLAAVHYKKEQTLRGEGDAAYKKQVIEADGALQQKLDAYVKVNENYAREFGKQKWVAEVQMGTSGTNGGNAAMSIIEMLGVKAAKDLALDMKVKK